MCNNLDMSRIKKQIYSLIASMIVLVFGVVFFAAKVPPQTDTAVPVLIMLVLIYALCANGLALVFSVAMADRWTRHITLIFLLACIPPAFIMVAALRQASALDLFILFATIVLIAWYATYKK